MVGTDLIIGLQGNSGSSAGVQIYDTITGTFGNGRLLAGLPSNIVNNIDATNNEVYIATDGGIGRWSLQTNDWLNPFTTTDGLPSNVNQDVLVESNNLWIATPSGVVQLDTNTGSTTTITSSNGMLGTSSWGLISTVDSTTGSVEMHVSHDGAGNERPGISSLDGYWPCHSDSSFDQLPSNTGPL